MAAMKSAFLLLFSVVALAQSNPGGVGHLNASCSAVDMGPNTTFICYGLTPAQQKLLEGVPALLNKLLSAQTDNLQAILPKLDTCLETALRTLPGKLGVKVPSGPRSISADQKQKMIAALSNPPGKPEIRIQVSSSNAESSRFARQLHDIFSSAPGWTVPPVAESKVSGKPSLSGLVAYVQNDANVYGFALRSRFAEFGFKLEFVIDATLGPELVILSVSEPGKP